MQYCAATVPDPSPHWNLVLYLGSEHTGACPRVPQDNHRAESAYLCGQEEQLLEQILIPPSQSAALTIYTHLQGFILLHHTELPDCHTVSSLNPFAPFQRQLRIFSSITVKYNILFKFFRNLNRSWNPKIIPSSGL